MLRNKDAVPDVETTSRKRFWGFGKKKGAGAAAPAPAPRPSSLEPLRQSRLKAHREQSCKAQEPSWREAVWEEQWENKNLMEQGRKDWLDTRLSVQASEKAERETTQAQPREESEPSCTRGSSVVPRLF